MSHAPEETDKESAAKPTASTIPLGQEILQLLLQFVRELVRAWMMLWSEVCWPLLVSTSSLFPLHSKHESISQDKTKQIDLPEENSEPFAEQFKYKVCTSSLLTNMLSISSYAEGEKAGDSDAQLVNKSGSHIIPTSSLMPTTVHGNADEKYDAAFRTKSLELTSTGALMFQSSILAAFLLIFLSPDREAWTRSVLLVASSVWGLVAFTGVHVKQQVKFDVSHIPTGSYKLSTFDYHSDSVQSSTYFERNKQIKVVKTLCNSISQLVKVSKKFDIECNKAISAIQEVELVARGYKLTYPLPPISRIEISQSMTPTRSSKGNTAGPGNRAAFGSLSRAGSLGSRSSHHPSLAAVVSAASPSRQSDFIGSPSDQERIRLLSLRKSLTTTFEEAEYAIRTATESVEPLCDSKEMDLLRDMYDLDGSFEGAQVGNSSLDSFAHSSWTSRAGVTSNSAHYSSSPTPDETPSAPNTPIRRAPLLLDRSASLRKHDSISSEWSHQPHSPLRSASRLSYVSERTPLSSSAAGPNQSGALKRLSYASAGSASSPLQYRNGILGSRPSSAQKRFAPGPMSFAGDGDMVSPTAESGTSEVYKLISLKNNFENVHRLRRRFLCCLLALDFSLQRTITVSTSPLQDTLEYWICVDQTIARLSTTMGSLADEMKHDVEAEMGLGAKSTKLPDEPVKQPSDAAPASTRSATSREWSDFEDRVAAIGLALRSIQVKLRACTEELNIQRQCSTLHGEPDGVSVDKVPKRESTPQSHEAERIFGLIREDLLALSNEWEAGVNVLKSGRPGSSESNAPNEAHELLASSRGTFDSPQESEEDAMRPWIATNGAKTSGSDMEENDMDKMIEKKLVQWASGDERVCDEGEDDLSALLLRSASPHHLPPPGLEKIYEATAATQARKDKTKLTREERIQQVKEQRAAALDKQAAESTKTPHELSAGMMDELQAVMTHRKASIIDGLPSTSSTSMQELRERLAAEEEHNKSPSTSNNPLNNSLRSPLNLGDSTNDTGIFSSPGHTKGHGFAF